MGHSSLTGKICRILAVLLSVAAGFVRLEPAFAATPQQLPATRGAKSEQAAPLPDSKKSISVTLFGGECLLTGPFNENVLTTIHSISPEKFPPSLSPEKARAALDLLRAIKDLPPQLETYREKLRHRLEGTLALSEALRESRQSGKVDSLTHAFENHLNDRKLDQLNTAVKQLLTKAPPIHWTTAQIDELTDLYLQALGPTPDEDFHRTIRKLDVQYKCSYGE